MDKVPLGILMNKGITLRAAQQHGQHYMPRMIERGYQLFKDKQDGCVRSVFVP